MSGVKLLVFGGPRDKFTAAEVREKITILAVTPSHTPSHTHTLTPSHSHSQFEALRSYLEEGGSVLVMVTEGGESKHCTNINFLLEEFGIMANSGEKGGRE